MTMRRAMLAAVAAAMLGSLAGAAPAAAQYGYGGGGGYGGGYGGGGGGYGYGRDDYRSQRRYDYDDDRPPPRRFGRRGGSLCVTARGNCPYPPSYPNTPCSCDIPGFGEKRGATVN